MSTPTPPPLGQPKAPRVVAELGRPETPSETAARKAQSSRNHRQNQTTKNLVLSLIASVGIVLLIVLGVVRTSGSQLKDVDYLKIASQAQQQVSQPLVAPKLPSGWKSNSAAIRPAGADGVQTWYVGLITPDTQFIGMTQGLDANPTWVSNQLQQTAQTTVTRVGGVSWDVYDQRSASGSTNFSYAMVATIGKSTIVLAGTASTKQFDLVADHAAQQLER
ncbi:hypothetical protein AX769_08800 [Frondihabitans sp. PAMC 28766]|uniref:DUF4245 domain-containing protein n=1 Tax=Frondihabitans sp. PAMC 28766 TaxID=1795630 RepID=UPI00078D6AEA|nr:DUF4245 domain-containing protein [Frondihabitans sp. PAMC 28766]AMM20242.1 hypothetical protein AX769_08800 [Frondihabitans sp. PAMC 28766]